MAGMDLAPGINELKPVKMKKKDRINKN